MLFFGSNKKKIELDEYGFYSVNKNVSYVLNVLRGYLQKRGAPIKIQKYLTSGKEILPHTVNSIISIIDSFNINDISYIETRNFYIVYDNIGKKIFVFNKFRYDKVKSISFDEGKIVFPVEVINNGEIDITVTPISKKPYSSLYVSTLQTSPLFNICYSLNYTEEGTIEYDNYKFVFTKTVTGLVFDFYGGYDKYTRYFKLTIPNENHIKQLVEFKGLSYLNNGDNTITVSNLYFIRDESLYPYPVLKYTLFTPYQTVNVFVDPHKPYEILAHKSVPRPAL
jgi:hypothetical protein